MPENKVENWVELVADSMQENPCKMSTQVISVSDIINKYFSEGEVLQFKQGTLERCYFWTGKSEGRHKKFWSSSGD
ncbi:hypothetical protein QL285_070825 [Trifolium repens]|nr:hypothetical protein QL285_070825 [Trifolium repens]